MLEKPAAVSICWYSVRVKASPGGGVGEHHHGEGSRGRGRDAVFVRHHFEDQHFAAIG